MHPITQIWNVWSSYNVIQWYKWFEPWFEPQSTQHACSRCRLHCEHQKHAAPRGLPERTPSPTDVGLLMCPVLHATAHRRATLRPVHPDRVRARAAQRAFVHALSAVPAGAHVPARREHRRAAVLQAHRAQVGVPAPRPASNVTPSDLIVCTAGIAPSELVLHPQSPSLRPSASEECAAVVCCCCRNYDASLFPLACRHTGQCNCPTCRRCQVPLPCRRCLCRCQRAVPPLAACWLPPPASCRERGRIGSGSRSGAAVANSACRASSSRLVAASTHVLQRRRHATVGFVSWCSQHTVSM